MNYQKIEGNSNTQVYLDLSGPAPLGPSPGLQPCPSCGNHISTSASICLRCSADLAHIDPIRRRARLKRMARAWGIGSGAALLVGVLFMVHKPLEPVIGIVFMNAGFFGLLSTGWLFRKARAN